MRAIPIVDFEKYKESKNWEETEAYLNAVLQQTIHDINWVKCLPHTKEARLLGVLISNIYMHASQEAAAFMAGWVRIYGTGDQKDYFDGILEFLLKNGLLPDSVGKQCPSVTKDIS